MLPPFLLDLPPPAASAEGGLSLAHSRRASLANPSSSDNHLDASSPAKDAPERHVTRPIRDTPEFFRRVCPPALAGPGHHCRPPCDDRLCRRRREHWAGQKMIALFATVSRSTLLPPLSGVRQLRHGPSAQETVRYTAGCRPARGLSAGPASFRYSCANPRCEPGPLPAETTREGAAALPR